MHRLPEINTPPYSILLWTCHRGSTSSTLERRLLGWSPTGQALLSCKRSIVCFQRPLVSEPRSVPCSIRRARRGKWSKRWKDGRCMRLRGAGRSRSNWEVLIGLASTWFLHAFRCGDSDGSHFGQVVCLRLGSLLQLAPVARRGNSCCKPAQRLLLSCAAAAAGNGACRKCWQKSQQDFLWLARCQDSSHIFQTESSRIPRLSWRRRTRKLQDGQEIHNSAQAIFRLVHLQSLGFRIPSFEAVRWH